MNEEKPTVRSWAEREIEITMKRIAERTAGDTCYDRGCYESALKAYKSLCEDGHSGFSFSATVRILDRLCHNMPLSPITDEDFPKYGTYMTGRIRTIAEPRMNEESIQCPRMSSLFKSIWEDGKVTYHDIDRVACVNSENMDDTFHWGLASEVIDERYPITVPYYPPTKNTYFVYVTQFTVNNQDVCSFDKFVEPSGNTVEVNRYFKFIMDSIVEIGKDEFMELKAKRDVSVETQYASYIINSLTEYYEDKNESELAQKYGNLWRGNPESEDYKYVLRDIWWMLMSKYRNNMDDMFDLLEKHCSVFVGHELAGWSTVHRLTSPVESDGATFVDKHPEFNELLTVINEARKMVADKINPYLKQMEQYGAKVMEANGESNELTPSGKEAIRDIIKELDPDRFRRIEDINAEKRCDETETDCGCSCGCGC